MLGRKLSMVGFGLALLSNVSCSRPLCDVNKDDPRCAEIGEDMANGGITVTVLPKRLSITTGATLQVSISDLAAGESIQSVQLKQTASGYMTSLDVKTVVVVAGKLTAMLTPAVLNGFRAGPVTVVLSRPNKPDVSGTFRLYLDPSYNTNGIAYIDSTNTPMWAGIWNTLPNVTATAPVILTLNSFNGGKQNIHQYTFDSKNGVNDTGTPYTTDMAGHFNSESTLGISAANIYIPILDTSTTPNSYFLYGCQLPSGNCAKTITNLGAGKITSISVSTDDTTFALANNNSLQPFYRAASGGVPSPVSLDVPSPNMVTWVGVGDIDGDGLLDVIADLQGADVSVFMRTASDKLQYDKDKSSGLKQSLSLPVSPAISALAIGDADGDGLADLLIAQDNKIILFINQGNGMMQSAFTHSFTLAQPIPSLVINGLSIGDVDGNSINDFCFSATNRAAVACIVNQASY